VGRADAALVRAATGFSIGGVPPLGHPEPPRTLIDEDLLGHEVVWAAAGTPHAVFPIAGEAMTSAQREAVRSSPGSPAAAWSGLPRPLAEPFERAVPARADVRHPGDRLLERLRREAIARLAALAPR
jgi:hypothetical protein